MSRLTLSPKENLLISIASLLFHALRFTKHTIDNYIMASHGDIANEIVSAALYGLKKISRSQKIADWNASDMLRMISIWLADCSSMSSLFC